MTDTPLIQRLSEATDWDSDLDACIAEFLGCEVGWQTGGIQAGWPSKWWRRPDGMKEPLPRFTGSVDAALSLENDEEARYFLLQRALLELTAQGDLAARLDFRHLPRMICITALKASETREE